MKLFIGTLDDRREGLVIAPSQAEAATVAGVGLNNFKRFWRTRDWDPWTEQLENLTLHTRPLNMNAEWVKGICALPRLPQSPHPPSSRPIMAASP